MCFCALYLFIYFLRLCYFLNKYMISSGNESLIVSLFKFAMVIPKIAFWNLLKR